MKTSQAHVAIKRIDLNSKTAPARPLSRNKGGARAGKWIEHDAFATRAVPDRIFNEGNGFDRWMKLEI